MKNILCRCQITALATAALLTACGGFEVAGCNFGGLVDTPVVLATLTAAQIHAARHSAACKPSAAKPRGA